MKTREEFEAWVEGIYDEELDGLEEITTMRIAYEKGVADALADISKPIERLLEVANRRKRDLPFEVQFEIEVFSQAVAQLPRTASPLQGDDQ